MVAAVNFRLKVDIIFSRHAKRRMSLYGIDESIVLKNLKDAELLEGQNVFVKEMQGFSYPLKVVVNCEGDSISVVTTYPLKKGTES